MNRKKATAARAIRIPTPDNVAAREKIRSPSLTFVLTWLTLDIITPWVGIEKTRISPG
jgi:hypothetical protein